jgi:hypothetical protein
VVESFYDFVDFVDFVELSYRETQRYDAGNTENVALMKQTRPTNLVVCAITSEKAKI